MNHWNGRRSIQQVASLPATAIILFPASQAYTTLVVITNREVQTEEEVYLENEPDPDCESDFESVAEVERKNGEDECNPGKNNNAN
ncbi:hypothetical protein CHS0354_000400 [Potamilus streckersoni]|uniref:Uncharacterized protein n=1 Tax=Potamilus streckersoni TaxID=2493646 RepID=A0AAE0SM47_9BIVA|nr:hypothetical protein CHS0354_000400 [Potamilus streckersoni]